MFKKFDKELETEFPVILLESVTKREMYHFIKCVKHYINDCDVSILQYNEKVKSTINMDVIISAKNKEEANILFYYANPISRLYKKTIATNCTTCICISKLDAFRCILPLDSAVLGDVIYDKSYHRLDKLIVDDYVNGDINNYGYKLVQYPLEEPNKFRMYLVGQTPKHNKLDMKTSMYHILRYLKGTSAELKLTDVRGLQNDANKNATSCRSIVVPVFNK